MKAKHLSFFLSFLCISILFSCKARYVNNGINAPMLMSYHSNVLQGQSNQNNNNVEESTLEEDIKEIDKSLCKNFESTNTTQCNFFCPDTDSSCLNFSLKPRKRFNPTDPCYCDMPIKRYIFNMSPNPYSELINIKFIDGDNVLQSSNKAKSIKIKGLDISVYELPKLEANKFYNIEYTIKEKDNSFKTYYLNNIKMTK